MTPNKLYLKQKYTKFFLIFLNLFQILIKKMYNSIRLRVLPRLQHELQHCRGLVHRQHEHRVAHQHHGPQQPDRCHQQNSINGWWRLQGRYYPLQSINPGAGGELLHISPLKGLSILFYSPIMCDSKKLRLKFGAWQLTSPGGEDLKTSEDFFRYQKLRFDCTTLWSKWKLSEM